MNPYSSGLPMGRVFFFLELCIFPVRPLHFIRGQVLQASLYPAHRVGWSWAARLHGRGSFLHGQTCKAHIFTFRHKGFESSQKLNAGGTHLMSGNVEEAWNSISDSLSRAPSPAEFYSSFNNLNRSHVIAIQAVNIAQSDAARCCEFKWSF